MNDVKNVKIVAGYIIDKSIFLDSEITQYLENFNTYLPNLEKLYVYNTTSSDLGKFKERLKKFGNIEYADVEGYGEAELYAEIIRKGLEENADYVTYLKPGYFYEEDSFNELKKYLFTASTEKLAVITPMPLLSCQLHERKSEEFRLIKGCRLIGAFLNLHIYKEIEGIVTDYYQTTFDYDYCLNARSKGYEIMLAQNQVIRNQNYKVITKKFGFIALQSYDRDLMDVYYETRNRLYLWEKYKNTDPDYVKLDKKLFKQEKQEMRTHDKNYRDKFAMIEKAIQDYKLKRIGKYKEN